ncbi:hypothetical protein [Natrialba taiwanensis]|uniref:Uncharacterized protein n=1 Tax=Natrialba taiwanensis DSM 12281 TaxID=1230458 RepID=M0A5U1_9EURY|nr:hypothetical protein [Natrialba taiwanensis]ELY94100.1 hypothetical protein C484_06739 [Natrialba taiwanensis DSM 12281]
MKTDSDPVKRVVSFDLMLSLSNLVVCLLVGSVVAFAFDWWPVGVAVALITGVLSAAADRRRAGQWLLSTVGILAITVLVWLTITDALVLEAIPWLLFGLAVGIAVNRLYFGVVRPVPAFRRCGYANDAAVDDRSQ